MLDMFWGSNLDSVNFFTELTQQMRIVDEWYSAFLQQCRKGAFTEEMYDYLMDLPTEHCGSWMPAPEITTGVGALSTGRSTGAEDAGAREQQRRITGATHSAIEEGRAMCGNLACSGLAERWRDMAYRGASWSDMASLECAVCKNERERRNRLIADRDPRISHEPFLSAPYVHKNNDPKYHAMLLRSVEDAKRGEDAPRHILWVVAQDTPTNIQELARSPAQVGKQRVRFLQLNDQRTAGVPGVLPLFLRMRARATEKIAKGQDIHGQEVVILKHTQCVIQGWDLHSGDRLDTDGSERMLSYLPRVLYL